MAIGILIVILLYVASQALFTPDPIVGKWTGQIDWVNCSDTFFANHSFSSSCETDRPPESGTWSGSNIQHTVTVEGKKLYIITSWKENQIGIESLPNAEINGWMNRSSGNWEYDQKLFK
jgi:hypothetical protein